MADPQYRDAPRNATEMLPPSPFITAPDLKGREHVVTIRDVKWVYLEANAQVRHSDEKPIVFFNSASGKPIDKGLVCGPTVWKLLIGLFGEEWDPAWIGKAVTLYPTTYQDKRKQMQPCVRIKPAPQPAAAPASAAPSAPPPAKPAEAAPKTPDAPRDPLTGKQMTPDEIRRISTDGRLPPEPATGLPNKPASWKGVSNDGPR